jgi:cytochrome c oxidase cbb3-type subunit I/II
VNEDKSQVEEQIIEEVDYGPSDSAARWWFILAMTWFPLFASFGFIMAIKFFFPDFLGGPETLTFGRIRPFHVNGLLFGFISSGLLAAMVWTVPRLCFTPLYLPWLAKTAAVLWNGAVLAGVLLILTGDTQGREYAELPWPIDVAIIVTLLVLIFIVYGTLRRRKEKKLYVTLWYYAGTLVWFPILYFIGNVMWRPPSGALNGVTDAIFNWYYGHNVLGLWFTTLGIPAWYYFIPKIIKRPLYSHLLSLIAFFSLAFFYTGVGGHHILQAPIPEWLKTIAVSMSILMIVPVITFGTNIMLTLRGFYHTLVNNIPLRFIVFGFFAYLLTSLQGSFQATRSSNAFLHFSQWTIAHAHLALLAAFGLLAVGLIYWLIPRLTGVKIWNYRLMSLSWWLASIGFIFFFLSMTVAGLVANAAWWQHIGVFEALPLLRAYYLARAMSGGIIVLAAFMFAFNILMTLVRGWETHVEEPGDFRRGVMSPRPHSAFLRRSQQRLTLPVIISGGIAVFAVMTFMVVAMPYMFAPTQPSNRAFLFTGEQYQGEQIYRQNGCIYCHSQFVRPQDWAMGDISQAGDFFYSIPNFLGTERTGPNLGQVGGKRPTEWIKQHYIDPRSVSPGSIMPSFSYLSDAELNALTSYVTTLGTQDLNTYSFQPLVPINYRDKSSPYTQLFDRVSANYNSQTQTYSGPAAAGQEWATLFEQGKLAYTQKCISCHGCSGNGQGPYARNIITRPANLNERISNYPQPVDTYHFWRVANGVPGTGMPIWGRNIDEQTIWQIQNYEQSFVRGAVRSLNFTYSFNEAARFAQQSNPTPTIAGTSNAYQTGQGFYNLYCAQCHGVNGTGDGPAALTSKGGYINPVPFNLVASGSALTRYGQYVWFVTQGVETTNMPPWKYVLTDSEIADVIFYIQGFSSAADYNSKWAPLYTDNFGRTLKGK